MLRVQKHLEHDQIWYIFEIKVWAKKINDFWVYLSFSKLGTLVSNFKLLTDDVGNLRKVYHGFLWDLIIKRVQAYNITQKHISYGFVEVFFLRFTNMHFEKILGCVFMTFGEGPDQVWTCLKLDKSGCIVAGWASLRNIFLCNYKIILLILESSNLFSHFCARW